MLGVVVFIIHRSLTWTTGSFTYLRDLFACLYSSVQCCFTSTEAVQTKVCTRWTSVDGLIRRTFVVSVIETDTGEISGRARLKSSHHRRLFFSSWPSNVHRNHQAYQGRGKNGTENESPGPPQCSHSFCGLWVALSLGFHGVRFTPTETIRLIRGRAKVVEEGDYNYTYRYSATARMTPPLRWAAAMRAILTVH